MSKHTLKGVYIFICTVSRGWQKEEGKKLFDIKKNAYDFRTCNLLIFKSGEFKILFRSVFYSIKSY